MTETAAHSDPAEPAQAKETAFLEAAFSVFCAVGVKKATMQMIASKAGVSRPALYIVFKSKDDITRAVIMSLYERAAQELALKLTNRQAPEDSLQAVVDAVCGQDDMERVLVSPHAATFWSFEPFGDQPVLTAARAKVSRVLTDWLDVEAKAGRIACPSPQLTAETFVLAIEALKQQRLAAQDLGLKATALAVHVGRGLGRATPKG